MLSRAIRFSSWRNWFTQADVAPSSITTNAPSNALDQLESFKLIFDLYSPSMEEVNHLWGTLGGKRFPLSCTCCAFSSCSSRRRRAKDLWLPRWPPSSKKRRIEMSERMTQEFRTLFEVRILHHYWLDDGANVFDRIADQIIMSKRLQSYDMRRFLAVQPTIATRETLKANQCLCEETAMGIIVLSRAPQNCPMIPFSSSC